MNGRGTAQRSGSKKDSKGWITGDEYALASMVLWLLFLLA